MNYKKKLSVVIVAVTAMSGCASHDNQDRYLLGKASAANIAEQSIRDVNVPNSEANTSASGVRAANAVRALNEGKRKELPASGGVGGGGEAL